MSWRYAGVLLSTSLSLCLIALLFWQQDWQYSRPTPRPEGLRQPAVGDAVALAHLLRPARSLEGSRPILLHFFNPSCPCSRFNLSHVRQLQQEFGSRVRFIAVLQADWPKQRQSEIQSAFDESKLAMDSVVDSGGEIARQLGVYSTPQAVLLNSEGKIHFRGNYNASRYCTARESEYARLGLESLLAGLPPGPWPAAATLAYGCPLKKPASLHKKIGST